MSVENYLKKHYPVQYVLSVYGSSFEGWHDHINENVLVMEGGCGGFGRDVRKLIAPPNERGEIRLTDREGESTYSPSALAHTIYPISRVGSIIDLLLEHLGYMKDVAKKEWGDRLEAEWRWNKPKEEMYELIRNLMPFSEHHDREQLQHIRDNMYNLEWRYEKGTK